MGGSFPWLSKETGRCLNLTSFMFIIPYEFMAEKAQLSTFSDGHIQSQLPDALNSIVWFGFAFW